jgi:hypothetical protein
MPDTKLSVMLADNKAVILKKWLDLIMEGYPSDQLKAGGDRYANPIGATITGSIEGIFEGLLNGNNSERLSVFVRDIVKMRAVQDFLPSQALSFILSLKGILRDELRTGITGQQLADAILPLERTIDNLALSAFDVFMECREKIYEIKTNEMKRASSRLLQMANLINTGSEEKYNLKIKEER